MKVISKPDYTTWTYEFDCQSCKSKLCAAHTDVKYRTEKRWYEDAYGDSGYHADADYYFVNCPVCDTETQLIPNYKGVNLPFLLTEKLKKQYTGKRGSK